MPFDNMISGILYGPQGPETRRWKDDTWGPTMEKAMAGNDNEDFVEKTRILGKYTFGLGTLMAIGDIILINNKGGLPVTFQRLKYHYLPWMGATVAYTAAVSASCSFRGGKSDQWNHCVGGVAAGAVVGKCGRSFLLGLCSAGALAALGYLYKDSTMRGYNIWPDVDKVPPMHGNAFSHKQDFSLHERRFGPVPSYWCRTPEEVDKVFKQGQLGDGNTTDRLW